MKTIQQVLTAFIHDEDGATMIEYALLVALIAVVVAVTLVSVGTNIKARFESANNCVASPTTDCGK
ncbi:MAG: Flp family type IVb pilin [Gemmatimonadota bacterium]|nr:Flp family type IVb pilin [Gemmatimonadota bacterium]